MTKTVEEVRRAAFEAWLLSDGLDFSWDEGRNCYKNFTCHMAWRAFNAALDAVEIQLPSKRTIEKSDLYECGRNGALNECRAAIEQTGLGLRIK